MADVFEVMVVGYGLNPIKLFETDDENKAANCCQKNNQKLLDSGVSGEVLVLDPRHQYYRRINMTEYKRVNYKKENDITFV